MAKWLEVTITLLNYTHSLLLRQSIIDECFSKETVAEIIKSFVSFFICLFEIEIFH